MHASNTSDWPMAPAVAAAAGLADDVLRLWHGAIGSTVRCVPTRRTVAVRRADGSLWFAKWRRGRHGDAAAEWRWLHALPQLGIATPRPIAWLKCGSRSLLITAGIEGRALDAFAALATDAASRARWLAFACGAIAPRVAGLHARGLAYRDLYWNHVFARDLGPTTEPVFLDVERVFAPRFAQLRWRVKDLAGLLASAPDWATPRMALRFLRAYRGSLRGARDLVRAVRAKAARIRAHRPKFG